jgi:hypothetical protein
MIRSGALPSYPFWNESPCASIELARQQLARCEVRAEVAGIVVYEEVSFGSEQRKPTDVLPTH